MFKENVASQAFKKSFNTTAEEETVTEITIDHFLIVRLKKLAVYTKPSFTQTLNLHHLVMGRHEYVYQGSGNPLSPFPVYFRKTLSPFELPSRNLYLNHIAK